MPLSLREEEGKEGAQGRTESDVRENGGGDVKETEDNEKWLTDVKVILSCKVEAGKEGTEKKGDRCAEKRRGEKKQG